MTEKTTRQHILEMLETVKTFEARQYIHDLAEKAQKDIEELESYVPVEVEIAELLHKAFCHSNHTDGCSWEYEKWIDAYDIIDGKIFAAKSMGAKAGYLRRAMEMMSKLRTGTFPRKPYSEKEKHGDPPICTFDMSKLQGRALIELVAVILGLEEEDNDD